LTLAKVRRRDTSQIVANIRTFLRTVSTRESAAGPFGRPDTPDPIPRRPVAVTLDRYHRPDRSSGRETSLRRPRWRWKTARVLYQAGELAQW